MRHAVWVASVGNVPNLQDIGRIKTMSFTDPTTPKQPFQPPSRPAANPDHIEQPPDIARLTLVISWVAFLLIAGGALASYTVLEFGAFGMIVVWPIGWAGGCVAARILGGKSKFVGVLLVAACFGIAVIAEVNWIHEKIIGADDWSTAISFLPTFVRQFRYPAITALLYSVFGAMAAWRQVSARYRYVQVRVDD
jgi:hypothetical protein